MNKSIELLRSNFEKELHEYINNRKFNSIYNKTIYNAIEYSIYAGGKRIRPILFLIIYNMYKSNDSFSYRFSLIFEMIHTYSLIHDDLPAMDNDILRRGNPTCHVEFDESTAILAGDGLLNMSVEIFMESMYSKSMNSDNLINIIKCGKIIFEKTGIDGMIGGQIADIESENKKISMEKLKYIHEHKTGDLIIASVMSAAYLVNAPNRDMKNLELFSENIGLAFQIKDDILDIQENEISLGKSNSDEEKNKSTYVTMYGINKCVEKLEKLNLKSIECINSLSPKAGKKDLIELCKFLLDRKY